MCQVYSGISGFSLDPLSQTEPPSPLMHWQTIFSVWDYSNFQEGQLCGFKIGSLGPREFLGNFILKQSTSSEAESKGILDRNVFPGREHPFTLGLSPEFQSKDRRAHKGLHSQKHFLIPHQEWARLDDATIFRSHNTVWQWGLWASLEKSKVSWGDLGVVFSGKATSLDSHEGKVWEYP